MLETLPVRPDTLSTVYAPVPLRTEQVHQTASQARDA